MDADTIRQRLGGKLNIPSLPEAVARLNRLIDSGDASMADLGEALSTDPPLSAKALRVANSAYYGLRSKVASLEHAASVLGLRALKSMVMQALVADLFSRLEAIPEFDPRILWRRAVVGSRVAVDLPRRGLLGVDTDDLLLCGLMHDIGEFVLYDHYGAEYAIVRRQLAETDVPLTLGEMRIFGVNHAQVGALVAQRWSLPDHVVRAAEFHHDWKGVAGRDRLVAHVAWCDAIVGAVEDGLSIASRDRWIPKGPDSVLELEDEELDSVHARARALWREPL